MEVRREDYDAVNDRVKRGELNHVEEAKARAKVAGLSAERAATKVEQARIAGRIFDRNVPDTLVNVSDQPGKAALRDRLAAAVSEATEQGFSFTARPNSPINANAVIWLNHAKMMLGKLRSNKASYAEINQFLVDEHAIKAQNDGDMLRASRKEVGEQVKGAVGGEVSQLTATQSTADDASSSNEVSLDDAGTEGDTTDAIPETSAADDADIGAKVAPSRAGGMRSSARQELENRANVVVAQLEKMGLTTQEIRDVIDNEPAEALKLIEKAERDSVRVVQRDDPRFAEIAARYNTGPKTEAPKAEAAKQASKERSEPAPKPQPPKETQRQRLAREAREWLEQNDPDAQRPKDDVTPGGNDNIRAMQREGAGDANAKGDLDRNGQEATFALQRSTLGEMQGKVSGGFSLGLRRFTNKQRAQQDAVAGALYKRINEVAGDVPVYILDDAAFDRFAPNADAYYNPDGDYIVVRDEVALDADASMHIMLHEGSHAAMEAAMRANPELAAQADGLRKLAAEHAKKTGYKGDYAFGNSSEFMAEVWGNPAFREFLARVPITKDQMKALGIKGPDRLGIKTLFGAIKNLLAKALNIRQVLTSQGYDAGTKSILEAAMDVAGALLEVAPAARAAAAQGATTSAGTSVLPAPRTPRTGAEKRRGELKDPTARALQRMGVNPRDAVDAARVIKADPRFTGKVSEEFLVELADRLVKARDLSSAERARMEKAHKDLHARLNKQRSAGIAHAKRLEAEHAEALAADFVPAKKPSRPRLLKLSSMAQISYIARRFFGKENNPVETISDLMIEQRLTRDKINRKGLDLAEKQLAAQKKHTKEEWEEYTRFQIDATTAGVHPDVPLSDDKNKHIYKADPKKPEKGLRDAWKREQHAILEARWNAMPQGLKDLYAETRDFYAEFQDQMSLKLVENTLELVGLRDPAMAKRVHEGKETDADREAIGPQVMEHIDAISELKRLKGPYFNLTRRGNYIVRGTYKFTAPPGARKTADNQIEFTDAAAAAAYSRSLDHRNEITTVYIDKTTGSRFGIENGVEAPMSKNDTDAEARYIVTVQNKYVEFFETEGEARQRHSDLKENPPPGLELYDVSTRKDDTPRPNAELASAQMRALAETIDKRAAESGMSPKQISEFKGALHEVSLRMLGSTRIQSTRMPRRYVQGASRDVVRNTIDYSNSASGYLARLEVAPRMEKALRMLEERTDIIEKRGTDAGMGARMIANEVRSRVENQQLSSESWFSRQATRLIAASFSEYLLSPGYSLVNSTQVAALTVPVLSADFNLPMATFHIGKAYKDVGAAQMVGGGAADTVRALGGKRSRSERFIDDVKSRLKEPRERALMDALVAQGRIDAEAGIDVARTTRRKGIGGALIDAPLVYLENLTRAAPQAIEAINRSVTALAAYRLHYRKFKDHDAAVKYASEATHDTQGIYANDNAAPVFSHPAARLSLQFMKYPQMVYYLYGKQLGRVLNNMEPGDRAKGIKTIAALTVSHGLLAGAVGMTFWEAAKIPLMIFKALGLTDLSWEDFEEEMEEAAARITGSDTIAELVTYGVPRAVGVDMSSRLGLQNTLVFGGPRNDDEDAWHAYLFRTVLGAPGSMVSDYFVGARALIDGDYFRAAERLLPAKTLSDAARATNQYTAGNYNLQEAVIRTFGLMPARHASVSRETGRAIRENRERRDDRIALEREFMRARTPDQLRRIEARIEMYNRGLEAGGRRISVQSLYRRRQEDQARWERNR